MARESKDSIRDKILQAAEKRFWHFGIKKTTIDDIAADAKIGKGTVYLHFESKEEVALAIITQYKEKVLVDQEAVAIDTTLPVLERIKRVLSLPVAVAHERCRQSPVVVEIILAVKPQLSVRIRELFVREVMLITGLIEEANLSGDMHVDNPAEAARVIKTATLNYLPTGTACGMIDDPVCEISRLVELVFHGLK